MEEGTKKFVDVGNECHEEDRLAIQHNINRWIAAGTEPMKMLLQSEYDEDLSEAKGKGIIVGAMLTAAATAVVVVAVNKVWPMLKKAGSELKERLRKKTT